MYTEIKDYNTFIVKKIHELCMKFNIVQITMDAGGGGLSIIEGLKDPTKLEGTQVCLYDMEDPEVSAESGRHIIKLINFSNREWYETAHYNLLKDFTTLQYLFPEDDPIGIEKSLSGKYSLIYDTLDSIYSEIEECKYQTTLIQEQTTKTGKKTWDLPKIEGVQTEQVKHRLKKDHFTSLILCNDAGRDIVGDKPAALTTVGGISRQRGVDRSANFTSNKRYIIKNSNMNQSDFNKIETPHTIRKEKGGSILF